MTRAFPLLLATACSLAAAQEQAPIVSCGSILDAVSFDAPLRVFALRLERRASGSFADPTKAEIYEASRGAPQVDAAADGVFDLAIEEHAALVVCGYADLDGDGRWSPSASEPFGWCAAPDSLRWRHVTRTTPPVELVIRLRAPRCLPDRERRVENGALRWMHGLPVVQLRGDARQRGFAHGALLAAQIVDFLRFYVIEDRLGSAAAYAEFTSFLENHYAPPERYAQECIAVLEGMRSTGADLALEELGRSFELVDLYAINGYIETRATQSSCTQFAAWGARTRGTDVDYGMIAGRNMDGECDLRRVTVSHCVIFAMEPGEPDSKRYVSIMWPGFVGTLSGLNEDGFYAMENAGLTGPGPVVERMVPLAWTMREMLAYSSGSSTAEDVLALAEPYRNSGGGFCGPGGLVFCAQPYRSSGLPAFVIEGDRFGERVRHVGYAAPHLPHVLLASNHPRRYGVDAGTPELVFDKRPSFSSLWRYQAGAQKLQAWHRARRAIGTREMKELLQLVAQGTTEHAIVVRPNQLELEVALASMAAEPWDAPYRAWTRFAFDELFER
ncbi:MAG: hypothetical protein IPN34_12785 [Planctomycetes bacterium]|nr:hypothetical protein [Planctomycetota bacterium]